MTIIPNAKKGEPTIKFHVAKKIEPKTYKYQGGPAWGNGGQGGSQGARTETALDVWNWKGSRTHKWDAEKRTFVELMPYPEWVKKFAAEKLAKSSGGKVANPFGPALNDALPLQLQPPASTPEEKKSTQLSTDSSSTTSKSGSEQERESAPTTNGESNIDSLVRQSLRGSRKTNKRKLSVVPTLSPSGNSGTSRVSFRSVAGLAYITDETTGNEYSEQQIQENTSGLCSFCDEPIGDVTEIHEFFGPNKFICVHCTEPKLRIVA
jgi:hypothetical protein